MYLSFWEDFSFYETLGVICIFLCTTVHHRTVSIPPVATIVLVSSVSKTRLLTPVRSLEAETRYHSLVVVGVLRRLILYRWGYISTVLVFKTQFSVSR